MVMATTNLQQIGAGTTDGAFVMPANDSAGNPAKLAFFGGTPVVKPAGNAQAAITRATAGGVVATFANTNSPASVTVLSTAEISMTVVGASSANLSPAAGDLIFINKPTAQASLGMGNVRLSSSNVIGVTFSNLAATVWITPTASQVYGVVAIRGLTTLTTTLTPASVLSNSCVEQTFAVTGIRAGELVQVNRRGGMMGVDIVGVRAIANNSLGITFMNPTAGPLTPTAAQIYDVVSLGGIDAVNNEVMYQVSTSYIVTNAAVLTTSQLNTTLTNLATTDIVKGVMKGSFQAGLGVAGALVSSAGFLGVVFTNAVTTSSLTPTANEAMEVSIFRPAPVAPLLLYSQTLTPVSIAANTTAEQGFTVTGLIASTPVFVNRSTATALNFGIAGCRVSAVNTLGINFCNPTAAAITPPAEVYTIGNFQMPIDASGNAIIQSAIQVHQQTSQLANALRTALTAENLIAGA